MELEAKQYNAAKQEGDSLRKENENLRLKVGQFTEKPDSKIQRDVEIMVRAEKRMMISAPGFAAAWETAKAESAREVESEESGKSVPKRFFTKLFGVGADAEEAAKSSAHTLTEEADSTADAKPDSEPVASKSG